MASPPASAAPKKKLSTGGFRRIDKATFARMVDYYRLHEGEANSHARCAKTAGVSEPTAMKAYHHGLPASGDECATPIKVLLSQERIQKTAVSTVLLAAKTAGGAGIDVTPEQRAELAAALGPTEFDQVRAEVRRAVRTEMDICELHRSLGLQALQVAKKLAKLLEDRANAILVKFGPQIAADGTVTAPVISEDLNLEMRTMEAITRTVQKSGIIGRTAIELERLRIGDPDALRRRLDSVYGSELGPAPGGVSPAEGSEDGAPAGEREADLPMDEVATIEEWAGMRGTFKVIDGGLSPKRPAPSAEEEAAS